MQLEVAEETAETLVFETSNAENKLMVFGAVCTFLVALLAGVSAYYRYDPGWGPFVAIAIFGAASLGFLGWMGDTTITLDRRDRQLTLRRERLYGDEVRGIAFDDIEHAEIEKTERTLEGGGTTEVYRPVLHTRGEETIPLTRFSSQSRAHCQERLEQMESFIGR